MRPAREWRWWRARMLGGRTNHWGRISLRMGPYDFKPYSRDGKGFDWPITYDDLAPYYDKTEELIGVFGIAEGLENTPDGKFQPAPRAPLLRARDSEGRRKLGIPCIPAPPSILTRPLNGRPGLPLLRAVRPEPAPPHPTSPRPPCCIPPALPRAIWKSAATPWRARCWSTAKACDGRFLYRQENPQGNAGARRRSWCWPRAPARRARLLLNSRSPQHPNGLANSSGLVGKYLMDTVGCDGGGFVPLCMDLPPHNCDGVGGMHVYMPWWNYQRQLRNELPFARGYHIEFGGGLQHAGPGRLRRQRAFLGGGYGVDLKRSVRKLYGVLCGIRLPRRDDPQQRQLLRNRPGYRRSVGHPGAEVPLQVEPGRDSDGAPRAGAPSAS